MTLHGPGRAAQRMSGRRGLCIHTPNSSPGLHQAAASGSLCFRYAFRNAFAVSAFFTSPVPEPDSTLCISKLNNWQKILNVHT